MRGNVGQTSSLSLADVWGYNKVADPGDMVGPVQGFSIFDTREPGIAMPLSAYDRIYRNQIVLVGHHQEVRRFISVASGYITSHHITSVKSQFRDIAQ